MSNQHIIQVRDLAEMLAREDQTAPVEVHSSGGETMPIDGLSRIEGGSRTVGVNVHTDSKVVELEEELADVESASRKDRKLLEDFDAIMESVADDITDPKLKELWEKVKERLND
jgi:hypothetical protein